MDYNNDDNFNNSQAFKNCVNNCRCKGFYYIIKEGDTLYKISKAYEVSVSDLMLANPYVNVYNLQINDEICIPKAINIQVSM
ncbi:LysM domain-containing protein [Lachnotalea glycerini]|jgi:hypothetical protein|uniref:LysM domain-containing protein n=1 Tax=Lachnotalea glycerini TaxID=1763509 RepID=A0A255I3K6_9FIRM|nr:LysM domain-containing protein [Lachnotalea glycerini]PXV85373.1 LysM domain-containing protein [Lachnotalea glycerini]RDY29862.1 LysM peptidoglycan-binding domain-containing protein [Lachnotalea glycerini]